MPVLSMFISISHHVKQTEAMRAVGTRGERVQRIQRDQSVSGGIQRPVVGEPFIGYALEIDGVPCVDTLTERPRRTR